MARILLIEDEDNIRKIIEKKKKRPILISWNVQMVKQRSIWR